MTTTIGRNDPCHCGSGKKYKKCCLEKDEQNRIQALAKEAPVSAAPEADSHAPSQPKHQHPHPGVKGDRGFRPPPPPRRGAGG